MTRTTSALAAVLLAGALLSACSSGDDSGAGPSTPGFMTRGVQSPETFYYRRLFTDAARAVEVAAELPGVGGLKKIWTGHSSPGAMAPLVQPDRSVKA